MSPTHAAMRTLPSDLDHLRGLRAARWTRESTDEQMGRFGPGAQRRQQDLAIAAYGMVDATVEDPALDFLVAHSGRTVGRSEVFERMLNQARAGAFRVLVVGYVSRFGRDLRTLVEVREELHRYGVSVLFCDERLLSSCDDDWERWAREAVEAEAYSRRMAKRQREGHAAKRRTGEPGGRPPYGFTRAGEPPVLIEIPERIERVRLIYALAAQGWSDQEIAARVGLVKSHVTEIVTNPIYRGVLRDGNRRRPVIDEALWSSVQEMRQRHSHRHPGPATYRSYVWSGLIRCRACGRRLTGHVERYRHVEACAAFRAARPGGADGRWA